MTPEELASELAEKTEDLEVFTKARDMLYQRIVYVQDHTTSKLMPLHEWAGTHAVMNMLDVVINNMERLVEDLKKIQPAEEVSKTKPTLRLVKNGEE